MLADTPRRTILRAALFAAGAAGLGASAGCGLRFGSPAPAPRPGASAQPSTDERALSAALDRADALATAYSRAVVVRPDLADALRQLGADHTAHVRVLQPLAGRTASATSTPSASATTGPEAPLTPATALSLLGRQERAATTETLTDVGLVTAQAARLLASVAACGSAHVAVLATLPAVAHRPAS